MGHAALRKLLPQLVFRLAAWRASSPLLLRELWPLLAPSQVPEQPQLSPAPWLAELARVLSLAPWLAELARVLSLAPWLAELARVLSLAPWLAELARVLSLYSQRERAAIPQEACLIGPGRSMAARSGDPAPPRASRRPLAAPAAREFAIRL